MGTRCSAILVTSSLLVGVSSVALAVPLLLGNVAANLLGDGSFEAGSLSLSPPPSGPTPLIVGGWAVHGGRTPRIIKSKRRVHSGKSSVLLASQSRRPTAIVQDVPLGSTAFRLQLAVYRERGTQVISLLSDWNRKSDVRSGSGLRLTLDDYLSLPTPDGIFASDVPIPLNRWVMLELRSDPRVDIVSVYIDGLLELLVPIPGLMGQAKPTTVLIGGFAGNNSRFRYDDVSLQRLADIELAEIRAAAEDLVEPPLAGLLMARLDAAAIALSRPAPRLASPELRAARRMLSSSRRDRTPLVGDERTETRVASLDTLEIAIIQLLELLSSAP